MSIHSKLFAWLMTLIICVSASYFLLMTEDHSPNTHQHDYQSAPKLVNFTDSAVTSFELMMTQTRHRFEKTADNQWRYNSPSHHHHELVASHSHDTDSHTHQHIDEHQHTDEHIHDHIELRQPNLNMFYRAKIDRVIATQMTTDLEYYGLLQPEIILSFFGEQSTLLASYHIGDFTPDGIGRYVYLPSTQSVVMIPNYQVDNIKRFTLPTLAK